jgi:hypothetical protein
VQAVTPIRRGWQERLLLQLKAIQGLTVSTAPI